MKSPAEQKCPKMDDKFYEGLGWMHAECCAALDAGEDPRGFEVGDMVERCIKDLTRDDTYKQSQEWDGEGYAEVGQKVSYNNGQHFETSTVIGRHECWLWLNVPSVGLVTVQQVAGLIQPLPTKEQRKRQELIELISESYESGVGIIASDILAKYELKERNP